MRWLLAPVVLISLAATPVAAQATDSNQPIAATPAAAPTTDSDHPIAAAAQAAAAVPAEDKNKAPEHVSTSWSTLFKDTVGDYVAFPKRKSTWVILSVGGAAALATHPIDSYVETHIVGNDGEDRYFRLGQWIGSSYVQMGSAIGLWVVGRYLVAPVENQPRTNKVSELGFDLLRAQFLSQGLVQATKHAVRRDRPTGECCAFPSGHAASAFAAASVLERHFGYRGSLPALAGAFYVGASRLVDQRHFLSDVMFGASIGMASGWTVVGRRGRNAITLQPVPVKGGMMIALSKVGGD